MKLVLRFRKMLVIAGLAIVLSLVVGIAYMKPPEDKTALVATNQIGGVAALSDGLARYYDDIDELVVDSEVIALGQFEGEPIAVPPKTDKPPYDPGRRELLFRPTVVLKGEVKEAIRVAQRVGVADSASMVAHDEVETPFEPGTTYILFLVPTLHKEEFGEFYWVTGAPQGAFRVQDGKVYSRNVLGEIPQNLGPKVEGQPLDSFLATLREKISSK